MNIDLQNQVAIITGGGGGIGMASAKILSEAGAKVYLWDIHFPEQNISFGIPMQVDITSPEAVENAVLAVMKDSGRIDILINNAGITRDATLQKMSFQQWQQVIDVNLSGVFNCSKYVSKHMIESGYGRIINTSSVVAHYGNFGQGNYVASKSGLIGMTKVWARELGKYNITVNAVAPGFIATDMIETVPQKVLQGMLERSCLKKMGNAEDIAKAYLFLASSHANFITAQVLNVDGGLVV